MTSSAFAALGLGPTASAADVKAAYRGLAKKHHPDLNAGDPAAEEAFKRLTSAYTEALLGTTRHDQQQRRHQHHHHQQQQHHHHHPHDHHQRSSSSRHARTAQRAAHSGQVPAPHSRATASTATPTAPPLPRHPY